MKRVMAGITALILAALSIVSGMAVVRSAGYHEYNIEDYVMEELSAAHIPGMSMTIVSDEKEIYSAAIGPEASTEEDYILGSLAHSITALGIMRMSEDGELDLEAPISEYLPQYGEIGDVTLEQLLHQTSGIPMEAEMDDLRRQNQSETYEEAYANYNLLGEVIEKISDETYEEYITENILDPCEMTSTFSLRENPELKTQLATVYRTYFGYPSARSNEYRTGDEWVHVSGGYLLSNVKDMGKYLQMYLRDNEEIMQSDSISAVLRGDTPIEKETATNHLFGTEEQYGMGWISTTVEGKKIYYQMGFLADTMSFMLLVPEKNAGIVMLFNEADYMVGRNMTRSICKGVTDILLDREPEHISSEDYLKYHGCIDLILVLAVIAAWMPIFLIGVWSGKASRKFSVLRLLKDIVIGIVLPTAMIWLVPEYFKPWSIMMRFVPDIVIAIWVIIGTLYLGAAIKLIQSIIILIRHKLHFDEDDGEIPEQRKVKNDTFNLAGFQIIDPLDDDFSEEEELEEEELEEEEEELID